MLTPGQLVTLAVEKPAAGGRMIARADGQVVLVAGAIPGERVSARVERVSKGLAHATTVAVTEASSDRLAPSFDPVCGGMLYGHIAYPRQLTIKGQVIADALTRIARLPLLAPPAVAASPAGGYRMRARVHLRDGRWGFLREGTHEVCNARATSQLLPASCDALDALASALRAGGFSGEGAVELSENIDATERAVHIETPARMESLPVVDGLTGVSGSGTAKGSGSPYVCDTVPLSSGAMTLRRHVRAFFQGNRFLFRDLVVHVIGMIPQGSAVIDLYAGVGGFAIAAAVDRAARVIAVEGDRIAARDLDYNAALAGGVECAHLDVEAFALEGRGRRDPLDVLIVDPPRTGMSKAALQGALRLAPRRIVYVSCDVATLARDARTITDAGYLLQQIDGFDLFPGTPHVETVVRFDAIR